MASLNSIALMSLVLFIATLVPSCSAVVLKPNVTAEYTIIQKQLIGCNKTYPQAASFLNPVIDFAGLGTQQGLKAVDVLRGVIALLDEFLFASFGSTPTVPKGLSYCLQQVIDELMKLLYITTGAYRILTAFLIAVLYLVLAILFPTIYG